MTITVSKLLPPDQGIVRISETRFCSPISHRLPDYEKGDRGIYRQTEENIGRAITHAKRALAAAEATDTDNPSTLVFELVEYLKQLSKKHTLIAEISPCIHLLCKDPFIKAVIPPRKLIEFDHVRTEHVSKRFTDVFPIKVAKP